MATILDENYGENRHVEKDLGGYILLVESEEDVVELVDRMENQFTIPEFVDVISCSDGISYTHTLFLLSSDYSVSVFCPLDLTPQEILKYADSLS